MKRIFVFIVALFLLACSSNNNANSNKPLKAETLDSGHINISVDASFKPVINEQLKVFLALYPNAKINVEYKSEVDCFKDLAKDSTRLIVVSRGLTSEENDYYKSKLLFKPFYAKIAYDAVAAIVNINNADTLFSFNDIKNILSGQRKYTAILDGTNATSTVKFLQDSVLKGGSFGTNVVAVNGSDSVIEAIKKTPNAIGFVSNCWVSNGYDLKQLKNLQQMQLALVECVRCEEKGYYAKASQATLQFGQYPLARPLYFIVKENWRGLGTGFGNFMSSEQGQLIFRRSCLVPALMDFTKRRTKL